MNKFHSIAELTDNNDHNEALLVGATALKMGECFLNRIKRLKADYARRGHLSQDLKIERDGICRSVMSHAEDVLNESDYNLFHGAY